MGGVNVEDEEEDVGGNARFPFVGVKVVTFVDDEREEGEEECHIQRASERDDDRG